MAMDYSQVSRRKAFWAGSSFLFVLTTFLLIRECFRSTSKHSPLHSSDQLLSEKSLLRCPCDGTPVTSSCNGLQSGSKPTISQRFSSMDYKNIRVLDMRVKSRMQGRNVTFGFVLPDWDVYPVYPGVTWYKDCLLSKRFAPSGICGSVCLTHLLEVQGRGNAGSWFVDAGAHLGMFSAYAAALGHSIINMDGNPQHLNYWDLTAQLNNWEGRHVGIHAVVGNESGKQMEFSAGELSSAGTQGQFTATTVTLDEVIEKHINVRGDKVAGIFIDVEGFEQEVLLGMKKNLMNQAVPFINIELWFRKGGMNRMSFPGLELVLASGYKLFSHLGEEFSMDGIPALVSAVCVGSFSGDFCLMEVMALRNDMLPSFTQFDISRMHRGEE